LVVGAYDNALLECVIGLYKTECVRRRSSIPAPAGPLAKSSKAAPPRAATPERSGRELGELQQPDTTWGHTDTVVATVGLGTADRAVRSRVGAAAVAIMWAVVFFGIIDFMGGIIPAASPDLTEFLVVGTSWGLLYTFLLPIPLIAWAVRPARWVGPQVVGIAAAVLVAGVAAAAWDQVFVALLVAASASFPRMWPPWSRWSLRRPLVKPVFWPVDALVAAGMGAALVHAWDVLSAARSGVRDDDTWYLMHLPMQAGFAVAVPVAAAVAVLALANRVAGWWFAVVPPAGCAMWFGVVSLRYPEHLGSLGELAGWLPVAWGIAVAVALWITGFSVTRARVSGES
jgi:hypothetical protein